MVPTDSKFKIFRGMPPEPPRKTERRRRSPRAFVQEVSHSRAALLIIIPLPSPRKMLRSIPLSIDFTLKMLIQALYAEQIYWNQELDGDLR